MRMISQRRWWWLSIWIVIIINTSQIQRVLSFLPNRQKPTTKATLLLIHNNNCIPIIHTDVSLRATDNVDDNQDEDEEIDVTNDNKNPYLDDPRAFQRKQRQDVLNKLKQRERIQKLRSGEQASKAMDLPKQPLIITIAGGTSTIFAMARQMAAIAQPPPSKTATTPTTTTTTITTSTKKDDVDQDKDQEATRWKPYNYRSLPQWNSQQYANFIWKNARRKYNKPAMWKYALRTFDRMLESQTPQNTHFEAALAACAKLGDSTRALQIYQTIIHKMDETRILNSNQAENPNENGAGDTKTPTATTKKYPSSRKIERSTGNNVNNNNNSVSLFVTENMIFSLIRACVRDARRQSKREPLDQATAIVQTMTEHHGIAITAAHVNPLAAAYLDLGYVATAESLLRTLPDRIGGPEAENQFDSKNNAGFFNVYDVTAKDKGSYALLVEAAISRGNYGDAVDALIDMTEKSGLYAESRHLSSWHERSSSKAR